MSAPNHNLLDCSEERARFLSTVSTLRIELLLSRLPRSLPPRNATAVAHPFEILRLLLDQLRSNQSFLPLPLPQSPSPTLSKLSTQSLLLTLPANLVRQPRAHQWEVRVARKGRKGVSYSRISNSGLEMDRRNETNEPLQVGATILHLSLLGVQAQ